MTCDICKDRGVVPVPEDKVVVLCECVADLCECDGEWPFFGHEDYCPAFTDHNRARMATVSLAAARVPSNHAWMFHRGQPQEAWLWDRLKDVWKSLGDHDPCGFFFHGPPGTGKTMGASILLNDLILGTGKRGRFTLTSSLFSEQQSTYNDGSPNHGQGDRLLDRYVEVPYLLLDDFGRHKYSDFRKEVLFNLINARAERRVSAEQITIVTSNNTPEALKKLAGSAIMSRLAEMCDFVEMTGPDHRKAKRGKA